MPMSQGHLYSWKPGGAGTALPWGTWGDHGLQHLNFHERIRFWGSHCPAVGLLQPPRGTKTGPFPTLQMKKLRLREGKDLARGHSAGIPALYYLVALTLYGNSHCDLGQMSPSLSVKFAKWGDGHCSHHTWNRHVGLTQAGRRADLSLRPDTRC